MSDEVEAGVIARLHGETVVIPLRAMLRIEISYNRSGYGSDWSSFALHDGSFTVEVTDLAEGMTIYPGKPGDFAPDESGRLPVFSRAIEQ